MSLQTRKTAEQMLAAATAGHRMAGMEPSASDLEIGRRQLAGELTADEAVAAAAAAARREFLPQERDR